MPLSVKATAEKYFKVKWTGGSDIHVSYARTVFIKLPLSKSNMVMHLLDKKGLALTLSKHIMDSFKGMEWLIDLDQLNKLILMDYALQLKGEPPIKTDHQLTNPNTGNQFHRIALLQNGVDKLVGGVRVWVDELGSQTGLGFRFRIESLKDQEVSVRLEAREKEEAIEENYHVVELAGVLTNPIPEEVEKAAVCEFENL